MSLSELVGRAANLAYYADRAYSLSKGERSRLLALANRLSEEEPDTSGCDHVHTCGFCVAREGMLKEEIRMFRSRNA